jgi:hypothetical protein
MSDDPAGKHKELMEALDAEVVRHRELAAELAEVAEFSAEVHDQAADLHEQMADPQLDPAALRRHAEEDRELARRERQAAQEP